MLQGMDLSGKTVLADRGYDDMNNILNLIYEQKLLLSFQTASIVRFNASMMGGFIKNVI